MSSSTTNCFGWPQSQVLYLSPPRKPPNLQKTKTKRDVSPLRAETNFWAFSSNRSQKAPRSGNSNPAGGRNQRSRRCSVMGPQFHPRAGRGVQCARSGLLRRNAPGVGPGRGRGERWALLFDWQEDRPIVGTPQGIGGAALRAGRWAAAGAAAGSVRHAPGGCPEHCHR